MTTGWAMLRPGGKWHQVEIVDQGDVLVTVRPLCRRWRSGGTKAIRRAFGTTWRIPVGRLFDYSWALAPGGPGTCQHPGCLREVEP